MENFNNIKQEIKNYNPNALCIVVKDKAFANPFLLVSTNNANQKIMLFDGNSGLDQFAEISYSKPTGYMLITSFEVREDYQMKGYGRFLLNLAAAHADVLGNTHFSGEATPTNTIKGISVPGKDTFNNERMFLREIYKKLGCEFPKNDEFFEQNWTSGEKIKNASPLVQELAYKIAETYGFFPPNQMQ